METNPIINVNVQSNDTPSAQYKTVILKPNMVDDVNTLTQAMVNQANTKYVIKYDYTLGGDINIPANCILEFDGGSIKGDISYKNGVKIVTNSNKPIIIDGYLKWGEVGAKLDNNEICVSWFKDTTEEEGDDTKSVQRAFKSVANDGGYLHNSQKGIILKFDITRDYYVKTLGILNRYIEIDLNRSTIWATGTNENYFIKIKPINGEQFITYPPCALIHNGSFVGESGSYKDFIVVGEDDPSAGRVDVTNLTLRDIKFRGIVCSNGGAVIKHFYGYGTNIQECVFNDCKAGAAIATFHDLRANNVLKAYSFEVRVQNCDISCSNVNYGIMVCAGGNVRVQNCIIEGVRGYDWVNGGTPSVTAAGIAYVKFTSIYSAWGLSAYVQASNKYMIEIVSNYYELNSCDIRIEDRGSNSGIIAVEKNTTDCSVGPFIKINNNQNIRVRDCLIKGNAGGIEKIENQSPSYYIIYLHNNMYSSLNTNPSHSKKSLMSDEILVKNHDERDEAYHIGNTAGRIYNQPGDMYIDTEINSGKKTPIWWTGSEWVDATGTPV